MQNVACLSEQCYIFKAQAIACYYWTLTLVVSVKKVQLLKTFNGLTVFWRCGDCGL